MPQDGSFGSKFFDFKLGDECKSGFRQVFLSERQHSGYPASFLRMKLRSINASSSAIDLWKL